MKRALQWMQRRLLLLLLASYAVGGLAPALGLRMRSMTIGSPTALGNAGGVSLPVLMVGVLLFVAGLGASSDEIRRIVLRPRLLLVGLAANALYPVVFATLTMAVLASWNDAAEAQSLLAGLGMVGTMPIAGASTAWSQNTDGNLALSLGLVWGSTLLSPIVTPLALHAFVLLTQGEWSADLHQLAHQGATLFVIVAVVVPSLLGVVTRAIVRPWRLARVIPGLRLLTLVDLLVLSYANASVALPQAIARPEPAFIVLALGTAMLMCGGAFTLGWWIPRRLRASHGEQTALMFGLGMNNNGAGLVLASAALARHPLVLLTILLYNLVQQAIAGIVDAIRRRGPIAITTSVPGRASRTIRLFRHRPSPSP